jgi:5'-3' exonuclease
MSKQSHHNVNVHLVDGTYELFRNYFGAPKRKSSDGREVGATVGLLRSLVFLLNTPGTTHVACAFDHVIKSFRNKLYPGYKTEEGIDKELLAQFPLAEKAVSALGIVVWPMIEFEADDALATAAARFKDAKGVKQVIICSPDKDLAQSVRGKKVVCWDRRREIVYDEKGVVQKFGVYPESIPDWLALVGDTADGYPGIQGWGEKSTTSVLARYKRLENIPGNFQKWKVAVRGAEHLSENLESHRDDALLFRRLATLREDVPLKEKLADLEWQGAKKSLKSLCNDLGVSSLPERISTWR